jgi:diamine N-acetyltransferase
MTIPSTYKSIAEACLRDATAQDALCLSVLAMQVFLDTYATDGIRPEIAREVLAGYSQSTFSTAIADGGTRIIVAEINNHLIGFAQITLSANQDLAPLGKQAQLQRLYVQEPFTSAKIGTKLLEHAEQLAANTGATVFWLSAWVHNDRALAFYAKRGYTDYGLTYFTFEGESHQNRVLAKSVTRNTALCLK